jgi:hypothetical protein
MTQDEIIEMAIKAGFLTNELKSYVISPYTSEDQNLYQELKAFAKLLAEKDIKEALAQPEQEPVAWRYKPARENNPRWEYTTKHPLDMGDGYLRPSLVEYCKCIEPLYAREKPKLMLEKFREMNDLLDDITPPQRKPLTNDAARKLWSHIENVTVSEAVTLLSVVRATEAAHGIKE